MLQITRDHGGEEVEVHKGETFEIVLHENPTTGYRWLLQPPSSNALEVVGDTFERHSTNLGAGGSHRWTVRGKSAGTATIDMEHKRPWEARAVDEFHITVRVRDEG